LFGKAWYYTLAIFLALTIMSIFIWKFTYRSRLPNCIAILAILCFVVSLFWLWAVAQVLVHAIDFIGVTAGIPAAFLSLTLLAIGNSAPGR
jgi:Ca2+/Na+ antiporter